MNPESPVIAELRHRLQTGRNADAIGLAVSYMASVPDDQVRLAADGLSDEMRRYSESAAARFATLRCAIEQQRRETNAARSTVVDVPRTLREVERFLKVGKPVEANILFSDYVKTLSSDIEKEEAQSRFEALVKKHLRIVGP